MKKQEQINKVQDPVLLTEDGLKLLSKEDLIQAFLSLKEKHTQESARYQKELLAKNEEIYQAKKRWFDHWNDFAQEQEMKAKATEEQ